MIAAPSADRGPRAAADDGIDRRARLSQAGSWLLIAGFAVFWAVRTNGVFSASLLALLIGFVVTCAGFGRWAARRTSWLVAWHPGVGYELLCGFFIVNTALFVLVLVSPFGILVDVMLLLAVALLLFALGSRGHPGPRATAQAEFGSLACIAFTGLAATLWIGDLQPVIHVDGDVAVFQVWQDVFIHAREISAFAQSHGLASLSDIKLAGQPAPVYHFASYMMPAALNALTPMSGLDAYAAFQLPFGILICGVAAYVLAAILVRGTWPAVVASAVLTAAPDALEQGFGIRYFSFHFMSQVNLGMLYGLACIALAWVFMIEGCRRDRFTAVLFAYVLLAVCLGYKAHLFVANALILLIYPCLFFGRGSRRIPVGWRPVAIVAMVGVFVAAVAVSQRSPRMPTLRIDHAGIGGYVQILDRGFADGRLKSAFDAVYGRTDLPTIGNLAVVLTMLVIGSFGVWTLIAPLAIWKARRTLDPPTIGFVVLVVVNYLVMSTTLALDTKHIGSPEEFLNRPHAWAWFVVVVVATAALVRLVMRDRIALPLLPVLVGAALLLFAAFRNGHDLETFPEWKSGFDRYADFNASPVCLVQSAWYVRAHSGVGDVLQDAHLDPRQFVSALSERQASVASGHFGGHEDVAAARLAQFESVQQTHDAGSLQAWARSNGVDWYLMWPDDATGWQPAFLDGAQFTCGGFRVFRFAR